MAPAADALCDRVAPGLIVREPCEYGVAFAAHRRRIPQMQIGISQSRIEHGVLADDLNVVAPAHGRP